jgi:hypothetical protein
MRLRMSLFMLALLGLLAGQTYAACNLSASVAGRQITCCGGIRQFVQICTTGGTPGCDSAAHRINCGGCMINQAAHCTASASSASQPTNWLDKADVLALDHVSAPALGCGGSLEQWVGSHRHSSSKMTEGRKAQTGL